MNRREWLKWLAMGAMALPVAKSVFVFGSGVWMPARHGPSIELLDLLGYPIAGTLKMLGNITEVGFPDDVRWDGDSITRGAAGFRLIGDELPWFLEEYREFGVWRFPGGYVSDHRDNSLTLQWSRTLPGTRQARGLPV